MASIKQVQASVAKHDTPVAIEILDAQGEKYLALDGTPATISVVGSQSERARRWEDAERERLWKGAVRDHDARNLDSVCTAVVDWHGWDDGKKDLPCTPENVRALLGAPEARHILRQVENGINNHALFSAASSGD
jgi:hypothetical protein